MALFLLPQKLDKRVYVGTAVTYFFFGNAVKFVPYAMQGMFTRATVCTSLALLPAGGLLLLAIAVYYLYRSLGEPFLDRSSTGGRLTLVLAVWTLSYMLLYGALGVWFPRQSYLLLIPLCLLLGLIFRRTVAVWTFPGTLLQLLPQVLLAGHLVMVSPVVNLYSGSGPELGKRK